MNRDEMKAFYRAQLEESDKHRKQAAQQYFLQKTNLKKAIKSQILPAIVTIETATGAKGTGFFQHDTWLVSNAHVLPSSDEFAGMTLYNYRGEIIPTVLNKAFYRPENDFAPDLVILNIDSENSVSLPTRFSGDESVEQTLFFYYDIADKSIKYICLLTNPASSPVTFIHEDGTLPMPGSSGSPIFEARVIIARQPIWQFRVIGALYARCDPTWHNQHVSDKTEVVSDDTRLVCAIPVQPDFSQILKTVLFPTGTSERYTQMSAASANFRDSQGQEDKERYDLLSQQSSKSARHGLQAFEKGVTVLNISLPDGLEKLIGDRILRIDESLMIRKNLEKLSKGERNQKTLLDKVPDVEAQSLQEDFNNLLKSLQKQKVLTLKSGDGFYLSPNGYFRIDVAGGSKKSSYWKLECQDCTGKGFKIRTKPVSSTFAIVKIPCGQPEISGTLLAKLLHQSQQAQTEKIANGASKMAQSVGATSARFFLPTPVAETKTYDFEEIHQLLKTKIQAQGDESIAIVKEPFSPLLQGAYGLKLGTDFCKTVEITIKALKSQKNSKRTALFILNSMSTEISTEYDYKKITGTHWFGLLIKVNKDDTVAFECFDSASDGKYYDQDYEGTLDDYEPQDGFQDRAVSRLSVLLKDNFHGQGYKAKTMRTYQQNGDLSCGLWVVDNLYQRAYDYPLHVNSALRPDDDYAISDDELVLMYVPSDTHIFKK